MAELTLTGLAVRLEAFMRDSEQAHELQDDEASAAWHEGRCAAYHAARDLVCDYLAQELAKPDELTALREAVRRAEERSIGMLDEMSVSLVTIDGMAAAATFATAPAPLAGAIMAGMQKMIEVFRQETGPHMGGEQ